MYYVRVSKGGFGRGELVPVSTNIYDAIGGDLSKPSFKSLASYTDEHKAIYDKSGTVAGIKDVQFFKLAWDLDHEDVNVAKNDAITLYKRLMDASIPREAVQLSFSGKKGFHFEIDLANAISLDQFKAINLLLGKDLPSNDIKILDAARLFRITGTQHADTKLYKTPLKPEQLNLPIEAIRKLAADIYSVEIDPDHLGDVAELPAELLKAIEVDAVKVEPIIKVVAPELFRLDFSRKVKGWSNCKWAMANGYGMKEKDRHYKLLSVIATCKALNYTEDQTYYLAKNAVKRGVELYGGAPTHKSEIYSVMKSVFNPSWTGGTFSCKDGKTPWLTELCCSLGEHKCNGSLDENFVSLGKVSQVFAKFSREIDENKIKTGIAELDDKVMLTTSMLVGLLGNPGSGKSNLAMNILNHTSKSSVPSAFFSMDMGIPLVYLKLIQKHTGLQVKDIFSLYKNGNTSKIKEFEGIVESNYKNVQFNFKSGLSTSDIRDSIIEYEKLAGTKLKLVVVDYLECILGPHADSNANVALIANQLKDIANETETCVLLLLQTQKHSAQPDEPLLSMKAIKGSSVIEQACSVILSIWREGYSPKNTARDRFMSIATVKDRLSSLWSGDFEWDGLTGIVSPLTDETRIELLELRQDKAIDKEAQKKDTY